MFLKLAVHIALAIYRFLPFTYGEPETKIGTAAYAYDVSRFEECVHILYEYPEYDYCVIPDFQG